MRETAEDRVDIACNLAEAIHNGEVTEWSEWAKEEDLPRGAHAWWEIQTVIASWKSGKPVVREEKRTGRGREKHRANIFESEYDSGDDVRGDEDGIDPAGFSYGEVHLSAKSLEAFGGDDLAMRILVGCAVRHGEYEAGRDGAHIVRFGEHSFVMVPDCSAVIGYRKQTKRQHPKRDDEVVQTVSLEDAGFDPEKVVISGRVIDAFCGKHGCDEDEAEDEIRDFMQDALERERVRVAKNGCHIFDVDGYTVWVSPDAKRVTKYATKHIERTPRDVREGVPSRFGGGRRRAERAADSE